jgi:hypothetical protein
MVIKMNISHMNFYIFYNCQIFKYRPVLINRMHDIQQESKKQRILFSLKLISREICLSFLVLFEKIMASIRKKIWIIFFILNQNRKKKQQSKIKFLYIKCKNFLLQLSSISHIDFQKNPFSKIFKIVRKTISK